MKIIEILLIIAAAAIVVGVTITSIISRRKGKSSCGGDCSCCSGYCRSVKKREDKSDKKA